MAERWPAVDVERALVSIAERIDYPPTPDLTTRVLVNLAQPRRPNLWQRFIASRVRVAIAAAAVLLITIAAVAVVSPQARDAVAQRLGVRGAPIEQVPRQPTVGAVPSTLDLGQSTTLADARARVPVLVPTAPELGTPDAVYLAQTQLGGTVSLVYASRAGLAPALETGVSLLVLESRLPPGGLPTSVLGKGVGPETRLEELQVNGGRGFWLEGAPHQLFLPDPTGQFREDRVRLAANVLLWEQNGLLLRLEGKLSRDQAVQIAASFR